MHNHTTLPARIDDKLAGQPQRPAPVPHVPESSSSLLVLRQLWQLAGQQRIIQIRHQQQRPAQARTCTKAKAVVIH